MTESRRIAIHGAAGRMGRQLLSVIAEQDDCVLAGALEHAGSSSLGVDASVLEPQLPAGVAVTDRADVAFDDCQVIVDFSIAESTLALLDIAITKQLPLVIGTTGLDESGRARVVQCAQHIPIVFAPNYSAGVTLLLDLLKRTASALGQDYDVEVIEAHHRNKVDAPSGTALAMGQAVADGLGLDLAQCAVYGREGHTGVRPRDIIGFETIRGGDIIGDHTVLFAGGGERIEITHKASDRLLFSRGAIRAAKWLVDQPPGLYDMTHVIGIHSPDNGAS